LSQTMQIVIAATHGSTPRETGAAMLVSNTAQSGTIGGGQLEFKAIEIARGMLTNGESKRSLDMTLGPAMGQCCGGRVTLSFRLLAPDQEAILQAQQRMNAAQQPHVMIFGAGHTGTALARAMVLLPLNITLIDDRSDALGNHPDDVACLCPDDPESVIAAAKPGGAYIILTHSHALDYRLTQAALRRGDAAYVGMIGSATKRAQFASSFLRAGGSAQQLEALTCPIGDKPIADKRPEVIAALTVAQVLQALLQ
jgi:xanthine dehydrogenase accessory factor